MTIQAPFSFPLPVLKDDGSVNAPVLPEPVATTRSVESPFNQQYWMSLEEKANGAKLDGGEFPDGSTSLDPVGRREFVKLLGASMGLAGVGSLAGCAPPPSKKLATYHKNPDNSYIGNLLNYATSTSFDGVATALLVASREGRPIKIEGNPDHPSSMGAAGSYELAELIRLYDPQRAHMFRSGQETISCDAAFAALTKLVADQAGKNGGERLRLLLEPTSSPLTLELLGELKKKLPNAKVVTWSPLSAENRYQGTQLAFGKALEPMPATGKAKVIVALDADFLFAFGPNLALAKGFSSRRDPTESMNRLYVVEPALTVTGSIADHRVRAKGSEVEAFARALAAQLAPAASPNPPSLPADQQKVLAALAEDLKAAGAQALVLVGDRQPPVVHALAAAIHAALGSIGTTITYSKPAVEELANGPSALKALAAEVTEGKVDALIITARNPVYSAYADVDFKAAVAKAETFYLAHSEDETAEAARWVLPAAHSLESWGDGRAIDGSVLLVQPLIEPFYQGVMECELFALLAGVKGKPRDLLRESWRRRSGAGEAFDKSFEAWLQDGVVPNSTFAAEAVTVDLAGIAAAPAQAKLEGFELAFARDYSLHDGRNGNSGWLHELPDPITKLTWDNAGLVSPKSAKELAVATGDVVKVTAGGKSLEVPIFVLPGHADGSLTLALGYGRDAAQEKISRGVGKNAYSLRASSSPWFTAAQVAKTGATFTLATTQEHWDMHQRDIALEGELASYEKHLVEHLESRNSAKRPPPTLQQPVDYSKQDYRWAMAVDLNKCTGCSACVTACQAENNIPVVGKDGVRRNREMHWMRLDRYFTGADENAPGVITQPVMCQHCETAPCEYVCPVNATVHSDEGLNNMVYNRCIGTRYCSNNCPYKVRRFNYFHYNGNKTRVERLGMNPDVTVRARGVMEKCTYCVQRIERARIVARRAPDGVIKDGSLKVACQQACPSDAITFGSLNDASSAVSKKHADPRRYDLLYDLGTRPRTVYLARIKNVNPALASKTAQHTEEHG